MSDAPRRPLGVFDLVREIFEVYRTRFSALFQVAFLYVLLTTLLTAVVVGPDYALGTAETVAIDTDPAAGDDPLMPVGVEDMLDDAPPRAGLHGVLQLVLYGIYVASMVRLVIDARAGRQDTFGSYLRDALTTVVPVVLAMVAITLLVVAGLLLLVVPGIWVAAVFAGTIPVIVFEGKGLGALARSASLTSGYRWSIVGLGLVMIGVYMVLTLALGLALVLPAGIVASLFGEGSATGAMLLLLVGTALQAAYQSLAAIPMPLLYARLRYLKEDVRPEAL